MIKPYLNVKKTYTECPEPIEFKMHTHENHEIFYFLSGKADYFIEGTRYRLKKGDLLLMKKAEAHCLIPLKSVPLERIVISFREDALVGGNTQNLVSFLDDRPFGENNRYSYSVFKESNWKYYLEKICSSEREDKKRLYLTVLLEELCEKYPLITSKDTIKENISDVIEYINNHLSEDISVNGICSLFHISPSHTNRKFKQITGTTMWEYIRTKRLILAKTMLQGKINPTSVYLKCGFNDYCSFYKAYKQKFGISPKEEYMG